MSKEFLSIYNKIDYIIVIEFIFHVYNFNGLQIITKILQYIHKLKLII